MKRGRVASAQHSTAKPSGRLPCESPVIVCSWLGSLAWAAPNVCASAGASRQARGEWTVWGDMMGLFTNEELIGILRHRVASHGGPRRYA